LTRMEYLHVLSGRFGQAYRYRLFVHAEELAQPSKFLLGLKPVETLREEANLAPTSRKPSVRLKPKSNTLPLKTSVKNPGNLAPRAGARIRR